MKVIGRSRFLAFKTHSREIVKNKKQEGATTLEQDKLSTTEIFFNQTLLQYNDGYESYKVYLYNFFNWDNSYMYKRKILFSKTYDVLTW